MVNRALFGSSRARGANTLNEAGGLAYTLPPEHALAALVSTGTFSGTFYADAQSQLDTVLDLASRVKTRWVAKVAIYGRHSAFMKDAPAALTAYLFAKDSVYFPQVFDAVIDNGRMLRTFVQMVRSGRFGRKSFGSRGKRAIQGWLNTKSDVALLRASVGTEPSLRDVLRMVHPSPKDAARQALFRWIAKGELVENGEVPAALAALRAWHDGRAAPPRLDWRLLAREGMTTQHWKAIGRAMGWMALRMNLRTLQRHGCFDDAAYVAEVAARLRDADEIRRARQFPYQVFTAWKHGADLPHEIQEALQDALEVSLVNVPALPGNVVVVPDVSGSMQAPVTGYRRGQSSAVRCVDVAALVAAALVRRNPGRVRVLPVDTAVYEPRVNPRDSVASMATMLTTYGGGGTALSLAVKKLRKEKLKADLVVFVSDSESWADMQRFGTYGRWSGNAPALGAAWAKYRAKFKEARLVAIDIQPYKTRQVEAGKDALLVAGFSDAVFHALGAFANAKAGAGDFWVKKIDEEVTLT